MLRRLSFRENREEGSPRASRGKSLPDLTRYVSGKFGYLSRKSSLTSLSAKETEHKEGDEGKEEQEENWQVHPVQDDVCTVDVVSRLCHACIRQMRNIPFFKKKRVSGLQEVETTLNKLDGKLKVEKELLERYESTQELRQSLSFLQDNLVLLSRKLVSVSRRKYFLDAAYSKRILVLHQSLISAMNDVFLCLSRLVVTSSLHSRRSDTIVASMRIIKDSQKSLLESACSPIRSPTSPLHQSRNRSLSEDDDEYEAVESEVSEDEHDSRPEEEKSFSSKEEGEKEETEQGGRQNEEPARVRSPTCVPEHTFVAHDKGSRFYEIGSQFLFDWQNNGEGDERKAFAYFAKAAQLKYAPAMIALGRLYEKGSTLEGRDLEMARQFYRAAADLGSPAGLRALALFEIENRDYFYPENTDKASHRSTVLSHGIEYLQRAARLGDAEAMCSLGELYTFGAKGLNRDKAKAKALFAAGAQAGHSRSQNNLGVLLLQNSHTRKEGINLLEISASKGYAKAQNNLGMLYEGIAFVPTKQHGDENHEINIPLAKRFYRKAADQNFGLAMHNLAYVLLGEAQSDQHPKGEEKLAEAIDLLYKSAAQGVVESNYYLGKLHETGRINGRPEEEAAMFYYRKIVESRDDSVEGRTRTRSKLFHQACLRLANLYYKQKAFRKAAHLYQSCAQSGCTVSMNALGLLYENGTLSFGAPDFKKAFQFYQQAHLLGNTDASINLAILYSRGIGVEKKDIGEAKALLQMAVRKNGSRLAAELLRAL